MSDALEALISPDTIKVGSIRVRKPTAGTLAICDFARLSLLTGAQSEVPFFEALAFFFIHSNPVKTVRSLVFDTSMGKNESGTSVAFADAVLDWADGVEIGSINEMGVVIGDLINEAMTPHVEPKSPSTNQADVEAIIKKETEEKKMVAQDS